MFNLPAAFMSSGLRQIPYRGKELAGAGTKMYCRVKGQILGFLESPTSKRDTSKLEVAEDVVNRVNAAIGPSNRRLAFLLGEDLVSLGYYMGA
jgi:hypothetical protein